ncbi:hypothetical protein [Streptomyces sp. W16]|uniref:hypothetical protein n=1 Tax=Streptomyces sp. W16 TaxID=3076631 RepID=UPI003FA34BA7
MPRNDHLDFVEESPSRSLVGARVADVGAGTGIATSLLRHWAFAALTASPGAHDRYNRRRDTGDDYHAALRNLFNRILGQLHHRLTTRHKFDESIGLAPTVLPPLATAA